MAGRIVKIAKGGFQKTAEKNISYYAKNINTNAAGSVSETGGDGIMFGTPKPAVPWEMPNAEFPDYSTSYQKTMPKEVANNSFTPQKSSSINNEREDEDSTNTKNKIKITIGVFFDGTLNNRYNTKARWLYKERKAGKKLGKDENKQADTYKTWYGGKRSDTGSYENDLSNVARLEKFYDTSKSTTVHVKDKVYVEGIGTLDGVSDSTSGFAFGTGDTGIRSKVKKGIELIADLLYLKAKSKKIEVLTINAYGFSRGAAAARNFIHEVTQEKGAFKMNGIRGKKIYYKVPYGYLGEELVKRDIDIDNLCNLKIQFAGLFDTVSSHDMNGNEKGGKDENGKYDSDEHNDVEELHLDAVGKANKIVHFTAADEHRENFALTTVSKSKKIADIEKSFPGVHSDIGGAYTTSTEYVDELINGNNTTRAQEQKWLMDQGWYRKNQLTNGYVNSSTLFRTYTKLSGTRFIYRNYSFIPLELMARYSNNEKNITIDLNTLSDDYNIYEQLPSEENNSIPLLTPLQKKALTDIKKRLENYVFHNDTKIVYYTKTELAAKQSDFEIIQKQKDHDMLWVLRNQFFHFSANFDWIGMDPNIENGTRKRKQFEG